jgi:cytochrome c peroxidase
MDLFAFLTNHFSMNGSRSFNWNTASPHPKWILMAVLLAGTIASCNRTPDEPEITADSTPYQLVFPAHVTPPILPADNPLTQAKVELGRMLFHETALSGDETMSCATCHLQSAGFSDTARFSIGIQGLPGHRQAMAVSNMAWNSNRFFWDGRAELLRHQSLLPIEDELEMDENLDDVIAKLSVESEYIHQFTRAFGDGNITRERISLTLEQFMLSIVSYGSRYDQHLAGESVLNESELRGLDLFFMEYNPFFPEFSGADCAHCHSGINFENDDFMNNGLDSDAAMQDSGFMVVTGSPQDRARFKVTSLRNIELTPPYMHDGRFATLEEVVDHYNEGIQLSATVDPALAATQETGLLLDEQGRLDLVAFLKCLTDPTLAENPQYKSPF